MIFKHPCEKNMRVIARLSGSIRKKNIAWSKIRFGSLLFMTNRAIVHAKKAKFSEISGLKQFTYYP